MLKILVDGPKITYFFLYRKASNFFQHFAKGVPLYIASLFSGSSTKTDRCNLAPCAYPRNSCTNGYVARPIQGKVICINGSANTSLPPASCCPVYGLWSVWSAWSNCSSPCGSCSNATRTRVCGSAPYGCPCNTSGVLTTSETLPCNILPCVYPNSSCCNGYTAMQYNGGLYCVSTVGLKV